MARRRQLKTKKKQPWPLQWPRGAQPKTQEDDHNHDNGQKGATKNTKG